MRAIAAGLLAVCVVSSALPARAQVGPDKAQQLSAAAAKLMKSGAYAQACLLLEQSEKVSPGMGAKFRVADCYEKAGRVASAWTLFTSIAETANQEGDDEREQTARQRAAALEPRVALLQIKLPPSVAALRGLEVTRDGQPIEHNGWADPMPIDPGDHTIEVKAAGKKTWQGKVAIDRPSRTFDLFVPALEADPDRPTIDAPPPKPGGPTGWEAAKEPVSPTFWTEPRIVAVTVGIAGGVSLVVASIFGLNTISLWNEARTKCEDGDYRKCNARGIELAGDASTAGTISTITTLLGVAGIGTGIYLWSTAPAPSPSPKKTSLQIAPAALPGGAGGVVRATF